MICFWLLLVSWAILLFLELRKETPKGEHRVQDITFHALILALIVVMGFVPQAGYLSLVPGISFSLIHLPVLIGAYRKGWKGGLLYGLAFGVTSWIQAISSGTGLNAFFAYPWISVLPRGIFGFLAGLVFDLLRKNSKLYANPFVVAGFSFALTVTHTVLVFAALFLCCRDTMVSFFTSPHAVVEGASYTFLAVIALGALGEAILGAILTPAIGKALAKASKRSD